MSIGERLMATRHIAIEECAQIADRVMTASFARTAIMLVWLTTRINRSENNDSAPLWRTKMSNVWRCSQCRVLTFGARCDNCGYTPPPPMR